MASFSALKANVEGTETVLSFIQLIDIVETDDEIGGYIEFSGICSKTEHTAHGRLKYGNLINEATWIWTEEVPTSLFTDRDGNEILAGDPVLVEADNLRLRGIALELVDAELLKVGVADEDWFIAGIETVTLG